ncbi:uncharacterized protein, partial [Choristoneura fumiferana]
LFYSPVCLISWAGGQSGRAPRQDHNGRGWDIRLAVPGQPGNDYPTLGNIPRTSFSCAGREPGYYADLETNCQAFRVCTAGSTYGFQSFLCPNGTLFNQAVFVCDWWMNVNCGTSQQFFNNNSEKFGNLKLGPQLMKDIKKMLTHPMRNPYDKSTMKSNLVVMQDYKPPSGQLFPNSALMVNVDRTPNNVFIPPKVIQQNYGQNNFIPRDTSFAASTPSPSYVPASINTQSTQSDAEVFQRQRQNGQYSQVNRQNSQSGNQFGRLVQPTISTNTLRQTQLNTAPTTYNPQNFNNQRTQTNGQLGQNTENKSPVQWNSGKQTEFGISLSRQQYNYNSNQEKQPYTAATLPQFSSDITGQIGNEAKENLALVFSLLANSINVAKEYNNIAQQNVQSNTATQSQFQNVNNDELSRITNQISQLTSSQYSGNNQNGNIQTVNNQNGNNFASGKIVTTSQTTTTNGATQFQNSQYTNNVIPSTEQNAQYNSPPQQSGSFYSSQFQFGNGYRPLIANQNQIYSGQFYQLPVPEVTSQIYNQQSPAKLIQPTNVGNKYSEADHLRGSTQNSNSNNNEAKQSSAEVEIVKSHSLPLPSPAKLQFAPGENNYNSQESSQAFENNFLNNEGISAQLQDNIIGTIPHPLEKNKVLTYKKDQSYYVYTKLDNNNVVTKNDQTNGKLQSNNGNNQNAKLVQSNNNFVSSFQFIPSVSYQLDDEKEQEKILNAFKLNEFGSPKTDNDNTNNNAGYQIQNPNRRNDVLTTNVEFSVDHPSSTQLVSQRKLNAIYDGPSSYSAPQGSIGFLDMRQRLIQNHNFNSRLEKFDDSNNGNGYPKRQYGY